MFNKKIAIYLLSAALALPGFSVNAFADEVSDSTVSVSQSSEDNAESETLSSEPEAETDTDTPAESDMQTDRTPGSQTLTEGEEQKDVRNSILRIITRYEFSDGSYDLWSQGCGFLITKDTLLVPKNAVIIEKDSQAYRDIVQSRGNAYKTITGLDMQADYAKIRENVRTYIIDEQGLTEVSINERASNDTFALLSLPSRINSHVTTVLSETAMAEGDRVFAVGLKKNSITETPEAENENTPSQNELPEALVSENFFAKPSRVTGSRINGSSEYVEFEGSFDALEPGCPLINEDQTVVGLITDGSNGRGTAVDIKTIEEALDAANIEYDTAKVVQETQVPSEEDPTSADENPDETPAPELDTTSRDTLLQLIENANAVERDRYTEESLQVMDDAVLSAQEVANDENATKNRIEKAAVPLQDAINGLQEKDKSGIYVRLILLAVFIGLIVAAAMIVPKKLADMKKEDWQLEEEKEQRKAEKAAKKAAKKNKTPVKKANNKKPAKNKKKDDWDDADSETGVLNEELDDGATGVLHEDESRAWLIRKSDGKKINITRNKFVIGKSNENTDFRITGNNTISRQHCQILKRGNEFYVEDLGSTNGTYVDGFEVQKHDQERIYDGQELMISDEKFDFFQEN